MITNILLSGLLIFGILAFIIFINKLNKIIMQNEELAQGLADMDASVKGVIDGIDKVAAAIEDNPTGTVPQNVVDAFQLLKGDFSGLAVKMANLVSTATAGEDNGSAPAEATV